MKIYSFRWFIVHLKKIEIAKNILIIGFTGYDESDDKFKDSIISHPRPIPLLFKSSTPKVIDMSAGRAHLLILTDEGVFTLGNNAYGQCGRSIITDENHEKSRTYHHIPNIKGSRITAVTAGQDHRY